MRSRGGGVFQFFRDGGSLKKEIKYRRWLLEGIGRGFRWKKEKTVYMYYKSVVSRQKQKYPLLMERKAVVGHIHTTAFRSVREGYSTGQQNKETYITVNEGKK